MDRHKWSLVLLTIMKLSFVSSINIISRTSDSMIKEMSSMELRCDTDRSWFLCVWRSPTGDKSCAIQERRISSVCAGDPRIIISGTENTCAISIANVTTNDWGNWMCLVQDDEYFNKEQKIIHVEVATQAVTSLSWPGAHLHQEHVTDDSDSDIVLRVIEDSVTEILCSGSEAYPRPVISWDGEALDHVVKISDNHKFNNVTHEHVVSSRLQYVANLNDTNTTLSCNIRQDNVYSQVQTLTIIVDPKPLPLIKDNTAETAGIIAGVILSLILLLLILVLAIIFVIRRKRQRRDTSGYSPDSTLSSDGSHFGSLKKRVWTNIGDNMKQRVWSTAASGHSVPHGAGTRYQGNWSKVIHDTRDQPAERLGSQLGMDNIGQECDQAEGSVSRSTKTSVTSDSVSASVTESYFTENNTENMSVSLCPGPSLPETHFSDMIPNTVYHHSVPYHLDSGHGYHNYYNRKPSSVRSADIMATGRDSGVSFLSSRPVSALDVYTPNYHVPMRVSTPTCAGSKSSVSMFQCPHDCFIDKDETIEECDEGSGDTIEEMDGEEDIESIRKLVNKGFDVGTDSFTDSSDDKTMENVRKPTAVTFL